MENKPDKQPKEKPKNNKLVVAMGKKKSSLARARIKSGKGFVRINSIPLDKWGSTYERTLIQEPLSLVQDTIKGLDIDISTSGGGTVGQAAATRVAVSRGIVNWTKSKDIRAIFIQYDDKILSGDSRQREPSKPNRSAPRAKKQKSYR